MLPLLIFVLGKLEYFVIIPVLTLCPMIVFCILFEKLCSGISQCYTSIIKLFTRDCQRALRGRQISFSHSPMTMVRLHQKIMKIY